MKNDSLELLALKKKADQGFFSGFSSVLFFRQFSPFALKPKLFLYRDVRLISFFTRFLRKEELTDDENEADKRQSRNWSETKTPLPALCLKLETGVTLTPLPVLWPKQETGIICTDIFNLVPVNYLLLNTILLISWVTR